MYGYEKNADAPLPLAEARLEELCRSLARFYTSAAAQAQLSPQRAQALAPPIFARACRLLAQGGQAQPCAQLLDEEELSALAEQLIAAGATAKEIDRLFEQQYAENI